MTTPEMPLTMADAERMSRDLLRSAMSQIPVQFRLNYVADLKAVLCLACGTILTPTDPICHCENDE